MTNKEFERRQKEIESEEAKKYCSGISKKYIEKLEKENNELRYAWSCSNEEVNFLENKLKHFENGTEYVCMKQINLLQKKEIEKLESQIEKMKCCGNCKHCVYKLMDGGDTRSMCEKIKGDVCFSNNYEEWELEE